MGTFTTIIAAVIMIALIVFFVLVNLQTIAVMKKMDNLEGIYEWPSKGLKLKFHFFNHETGNVLLESEDKCYKIKLELFEQYLAEGVIKRVEE